MVRTLTLIALAPAAISAFAPTTTTLRNTALRASAVETETVVEVVAKVDDVDFDIKDELLSVVGAAVGLTIWVGAASAVALEERMPRTMVLSFGSVGV